MARLVAAALVLLSASARAIDDVSVETALGQEASGDCGLSAIQLRGQKVGAAGPMDPMLGSEMMSLRGPWARHRGSCAVYGCTLSYHRRMRCQCNMGCMKFGNCCSDFEAQCTANATEDEDPIPTAAPAPAWTLLPHAPWTPGRILGHPSPTRHYPKYPGFTLVLAEEFNHPIDLENDPIWTWSDGGLSEGQARFTKDAIRFEDGKMKIQVSQGMANAQTCSHANKIETRPMPLSSGELRTRHNLFRYGRYEVRMKAPSVQPGNPHINGNYISTFFLYRDANARHWREIDFELTGDSAMEVNTNVLSADHRNTWSPSIQETEEIKLNSNTRATFHTYAIEWLPHKITWLVDGKAVRTKHAGSGVKLPDLSTKIMMNLWVFVEEAYFGGPQIQNNRYPMESEYDWFRFYKWNHDSSYPCAAMDASCLTADDRYLSSNNPCDGIPQEGLLLGRAPCQATCHR